MPPYWPNAVYNLSIGLNADGTAKREGDKSVANERVPLTEDMVLHLAVWLEAMRWKAGELASQEIASLRDAMLDLQRDGTVTLTCDRVLGAEHPTAKLFKEMPR